MCSFTKDYWWLDNKNSSNNDDYAEEHSKEGEGPLEDNSVKKDTKNRRHEAEDN